MRKRNRRRAGLAAGGGRDQGHTVALVEGVLEVTAALVKDDDPGQFLRHVQLAHESLDGGAFGKRVREYGLAAGRGLLQVGLELHGDLHDAAYRFALSNASMPWLIRSPGSRCRQRGAG